VSRRASARGVAAWLALAVIAGVAVGVLVHLIDAAGGSGASSAAKPSLPPSSLIHGQATWPAGARAAPAISLRDQRGRTTTLAGLRGRTVVLTFLPTRCRGVCAREARTLAIALRRVPGSERPALVVVSAEPGAGGAAARAAIRRFGLGAAATTRWLVGTQGELAPVWRRYRVAVRRRRGRVSYTPATYLIDADGFERAGLLFPFPPPWPAGDLKALAETGS
jgi:cytochrome oxidase Cu insertion factor (SCO1/SenC/PrrC family)